MRIKLFFGQKVEPLSACLLVLLVSTCAAFAQSLNQATPAPIHSSNLSGRIAARDLGDARLTDHYYAFTGTPGDLLITIQSRNLNGDLDVFTANGLRPLLKLTLYAESPAPVTKGIYLRKREDLILRIEARSPNDDDGTYELSFGGAFEPIAGGSDLFENQETTTDSALASSSRKTKRVSSVGARLPEPEPSPEVATAARPPEATPSASPSESTEAPAAEKKEPAPKTTATKTSPRTRRPAGRRTTTPTPVKPKVAEKTTAENTSANTSEPKETVEPVTPPKPKTTARNSTRRSGTTVKAPKPEPVTEAAPEPESGPRLIIETNDGTLINRSMSSVRRVIVEGGLVVVTGKDGKIERIPLTNVVRMSIAQ